MNNLQSDYEINEEKQTSLELYVNAMEAYEMWKDNPKSIKILDVRTFEEYVLIGHAEMATNIPLAFPSYKWDENKANYSVLPNDNFVNNVKKRFAMDDTIIAMCRSGGRSAMAINLLAKVGFKNIYNIIDGFEGDKVDDSQSIYHGKRMRNGWKNSVPWTYDLDPKFVWLPSKGELDKLRKTLDL